jgi:hypothetical protein
LRLNLAGQSNSERDREGGREAGREGGRERERERDSWVMPSCRMMMRAVWRRIIIALENSHNSKWWNLLSCSHVLYMAPVLYSLQLHPAKVFFVFFDKYI